MYIVTARQMQELDSKTIQDIGIPGAVLMENAGRGTFEQMLRHFPDIRQTKAAVLAGKGNNGGDGFVIARCLLNHSCAVKLFLLAQAETIRGDAAINMRAFQRMGGAVAEVAVVREVHQHLGSGARELANEIGERGFVADECADANQSGLPHNAILRLFSFRPDCKAFVLLFKSEQVHDRFPTRREVADDRRHKPAKQRSPGYVFTEWHQTNFVVPS